jgi:hypothetical protein
LGSGYLVCRHFALLFGAILLFGPRRSHSSIPACTNVRPSRAAAVKDGPTWGPPGGLVLDGREHGGRLVCVGIGRMKTLVVDRGEIITGYSIPDPEDRLLLITTVYTDVVPPRQLTTEEIRTALVQAANFYRCSCDGLHAKIEPANTDASDLARRIFEIQAQIEVVRVVLISDLTPVQDRAFQLLDIGVKV